MRSLITALLFLTSGSAAAQYSGAELQRDIVSTKREQQTAALHYVAGVIDQTVMISSYLRLTGSPVDRSVFFCLPPTTKLGDVFAVVKRRMQSPEITLGEPAATHIMVAVRAAWPCRD